jgi:hypothetical protein
MFGFATKAPKKIYRSRRESREIFCAKKKMYSLRTLRPLREIIFQRKDGKALRR